MSAQPSDDFGRAEAAVEAARARLPRELQTLAAELPIILEAHPGPESPEPDNLGLFTGPTHGEAFDPGDGSGPAIYLYVKEIREYCRDYNLSFDEEAAATYLHELGHYLGYEEDDLWERGIG